MWRGAITTWRATTPRDVAGDGRKTNVGRDRPAGRRPVASEKWEENGFRVGHASWASSDAAAQRNNAAASVQAAAAGDARKEDAGRERPAGQRGVAGGESGERFADWARGAGVFGRRGAAQQRGPHLRNNKAAPEGDARATSLCISMVYMPTPRPNMCRSTPHVKLMD